MNTADHAMAETMRLRPASTLRKLRRLGKLDYQFVLPEAELPEPRKMSLDRDHAFEKLIKLTSHDTLLGPDFLEQREHVVLGIVRHRLPSFPSMGDTNPAREALEPTKFERPEGDRAEHAVSPGELRDPGMDGSVL